MALDRFPALALLASAPFLGAAWTGGDGPASASPCSAVSATDAVVDAADLEYEAAPADNPLRGLVPYVTAERVDQFPHSLEFDYFPLSDFMVGPGEFRWESLDRVLGTTSDRGCQLIMRVFIEYPGRESAIPAYLVEAGVGTTTWTSEDNGGGENVTPDYADPRLRAALRSFIKAFGARYDGDPRLGYITAGLLGSWGEWHTYPREDLSPPKAVQEEVMNAYAAAFESTPVLLRYPAGPGSDDYAPNTGRTFGYHDDSFAWATLGSAQGEDSWHFVPSLESAGALETWKTHPIGGEIRPELWPSIFTARDHPKNQGFAACVDATHVTWLMDSALFSEEYPVSAKRRARALDEVSSMGYSITVTHAELDSAGRTLDLRLENRGVAPFYADWPVELAAFKKGQSIGSLEPAGWDLGAVAPRAADDEACPQTRWEATLPESWAGAELRLRVPNPMPNGRAVRFANRERQGDWLVLPLTP